MIRAYAAYQAGEKLKPFEYDPGPLDTNEVEIDIDYCGICHSDLSMINNAWGISTYPLVPGHEVIGVISKVGKKVDTLSIGQKVGLGWHCGYCNSCQQCINGDQNLCETAQPTIAGHYGGFADSVRAHAESVVPIPENMDLISAGPLLCGGITVFNPLVQFNISPTSRIGIIGMGGLGHMALMFLKAWGCEATVFTSSPTKKKMALNLGATDIIDSTNSKALESIDKKFDLILSTVNVSLNWDQYINLLNPRGRLHILGALLEPLPISAFSLIMAQRQISGSPVGSPGNIHTMLDFANRHHIEPMINTFPMHKVNEALEHLHNGKARYRIVLYNEK